MYSVHLHLSESNKIMLHKEDFRIIKRRIYDKMMMNDEVYNTKSKNLIVLKLIAKSSIHQFHLFKFIPNDFNTFIYDYQTSIYLFESAYFVALSTIFFEMEEMYLKYLHGQQIK
jgi:hypothetical protein